MTKVLFINSSEESVISDSNKGSEAVITATVNLLRKLMPEATFASLLNCSEGLSQKLGLRVIRVKAYLNLPRFFGEIRASFDLLRCLAWAGINKYCHANWSFLINNARLSEYARADVIIYLAMDYYTDDIGTRVVLRHSRDLMLGVLLRKPVVIWGASMGPLRSKLSRPVARFVLNRVSLITVRDKLSRDFLLEAGINKCPLYATSDPAFLFEPAAKERIDEICLREGIDTDARVIIGVNPSHSFIVHSQARTKTSREMYLKIMSFFGSCLASLLPERMFNRILQLVKRTGLYATVDSEYIEYKNFFARLTDWLIEEYDATVLLIAHDQAMAQLFDDRVVTREVAELVHRAGRVRVIGRDYDAAEIKGIIGLSHLFIGARFHADIAALSQGIPTVCFPYYHKFALMSELGQDKYICQSYTLEETKAKVADAWQNREKIKRELESRRATARELAALNGQLVKDLLDSKKPLHGT